MTAEIVDLAEYRARRRDTAASWVVFVTVCFWPASLALSAGLCAFDAICAWNYDRWR